MRNRHRHARRPNIEIETLHNGTQIIYIIYIYIYIFIYLFIHSNIYVLVSQSPVHEHIYDHVNEQVYEQRQRGSPRRTLRWQRSAPPIDY